MGSDPVFGPVPAASYDSVRAAWCPSDTSVFDRHGALLHRVRVDHGSRRLAWTSLAEISPALRRAVLASEDRRFDSHRGVDWQATGAALWQRLRGGAPRGASTITMQLAALLDPSLRRGSAPRSVARKWAQMRAAWQLERRWSKDQILEAYLNRVTFRGEVEGIGAAADAIFAKSPHGLTAAESAVLAASLRAPNAAAAALLQRARSLAAVAGEAAPEDILAAVEAASALPDARGPGRSLALHAARLLAREAAPCGDVRSTIDRPVQVEAELALRRHLLELRDRSAHDGAVLVADNASGEVLAYVGSSGTLSPAAEVDGVRARRQAGSTLKPLLYAAAIERGLMTPATLLEDQPLEVALANGAYRPENYDGIYRGLVSVRSALGASLNVPAVRALLLVGDDAFARTLRLAGISSVDRDGRWYGPSLALGSADVSLWELTGAYRMLAEGGRWSQLALRGGPAREERAVFRGQTAWLVADMLADRESRATTFGLESVLSTPFWTAVKTGTSKDMRDNWCIGFSSRYTVGVWIGNFSGEAMHDVSGTAGAAPVWAEVMNALHRNEAGTAPAQPAGVVAAWTSFAGDVEPARRELYVAGTEPRSSQHDVEAPAQITSPADGSIIALDPDIPPSRQRIPLVATGVEDAAWRLDGHPIGDAREPLLWSPVAGRHELVLVSTGGAATATVRFQVRGARPR